jgi:hypothetical protein
MESPPITEHGPPPEDQPRRYGRRLFLATVVGGVSIYMCAMPANSLPRSSPGWLFVATQTQ